MLVLQTRDRAQVVRWARGVPSLRRDTGPTPNPVPPRHRVQGPSEHWFGLGEHVLALGLKAGDGEVTAFVRAVAAAAQLEPGRDLIHRPARALRGSDPPGRGMDLFDAKTCHSLSSP